MQIYTSHLINTVVSLLYYPFCESCEFCESIQLVPTVPVLYPFQTKTLYVLQLYSIICNLILKCFCIISWSLWDEIVEKNSPCHELHSRDWVRYHQIASNSEQGYNFRMEVQFNVSPMGCTDGWGMFAPPPPPPLKLSLFVTRYCLPTRYVILGYLS